jgi:hypothetical protein
MPTYIYCCQRHGEFEEFHSITIKLEDCPKCIEEGTSPPEKVQRLINSMTKGVVQLEGNDLVAFVKESAKNEQREAASNEKKYANLLGEQKYNDMQTRFDRNRR